MSRDPGIVTDLPKLEPLLSTAPIFLQPWWLEAVAPGRWGYVATWRGDRPAALMPFVKKNDRFGQTWLTMPHLTQVLGPWLRPSCGKYVSDLGDQMQLMKELIEALPAYDYFLEQFHYSVSNGLPFYWKGFSLRVRYTYVLSDLGDLSEIWNNMDSERRTHIRKAEKIVRVVDNLGLDRFLDVQDLTFHRQGLAMPVSREEIRRLDAACEQHAARKIFFAVDDGGRVHAVSYVVWNAHSAYMLMGGGDPELRNSGAASLTLWESIKFAQTVSMVCDFEGSMIKGVESHFRSFGARQMPYLVVERDNRRFLFKACAKLAGVCSALTQRCRIGG